MTTLPPRLGRRPRESLREPGKRKGRAALVAHGLSLEETGAGKESRTPDLNLGKVALYQLSYSRVGQPRIIAETSLVSKAPPSSANGIGDRRDHVIHVV